MEQGQTSRNMPVRKIGHLLWERPCGEPLHDADLHILKKNNNFLHSAVCLKSLENDLGLCIVWMMYASGFSKEKAVCYLRPRVSQNRPVELGFCSVNLIKSWFWVALTSSQVESPSCSTLPVVIFLLSSHTLCCKYAALVLSSSSLKWLWNAINSDLKLQML